MRSYSHSRRIQLPAFFILFLAFAACKKSNNGTFPPQPPLIIHSSCSLVDEIEIGQANPQHYWYTYTANGKLDSIYYEQGTGFGAVAYLKEDADGFLYTNYTGTDGKTPNLFDNLYNSKMQDSTTLPTQLSTSFQLANQPNTTGYGYNFQYKANGKLDGYAQTATFVTGVLEGMGVEYNTDGDITSLSYSLITGPKIGATVTVSGYDGHPSPYTGIAGWVFLTPAVCWTCSTFEPVLYALSPHNPTGDSYTTSTGTGGIKEAFTYEYNTQGYPTKRTMVRTNSDGTPGSATFTDTYTYKCK
jgi:hypothetical protein